jgi:hypothetical protein
MKKSPRQRNYLLYFYVTLAAVLFLLGVVGFARHAAWHNLPLTPFDWVYLTLQLIPMNSGAVAPPVPLELEVARFLIPLLAASAAVQAILRIFREQIHSLKLPWLRGHIIICGLSRKGFLLAGQFRRQGKEVVVIERDEENDWIESCREQGMFVLLGDASDPTLLNTAGVVQAEGLFAVCDNDGANTEIALRAQHLTQNRKADALICLLHVSDPQLCDLLRAQESGLEQAPFRLELFNVFERAARKMLQEYPAWDEAHIQPANPPRILIIGLGRMGENLALHIARDWWSRQTRPMERLRITIIDRNAVQKIESLSIRYPLMNKACELIPLQMEVHSPEFERADFLFNAQSQPDPNAIYICVDDDALGLHAGLTLLGRISESNVPIVVRMAEETGLAKLLEFHRNQHGAYRNLFAFGYLDQTCTPELLKNSPRDLLARLAHEEYIRKQVGTGGIPVEDDSLLPWDKLNEAYRKANYQWADHIPLLLKLIGYKLGPLSDWDAPSFQFTPAQVEGMARSEHELWCKDRVEDGWRYGPVKSLETKTSPDLVSWEHRSEAEREKDCLLVRNIPAFLGRAGFQVAKMRLDPETN